jgi:hypothetical protein
MIRFLVITYKSVATLLAWRLYHRDTEDTEFWNLFLSFSVLSVPLW